MIRVKASVIHAVMGSRHSRGRYSIGVDDVPCNGIRHSNEGGCRMYILRGPAVECVDGRWIKVPRSLWVDECKIVNDSDPSTNAENGRWFMSALHIHIPSTP